MVLDAYAHCAALVRATDTDRFVASLFAPAERRRHLFALYAFNIEVARTREVAREPMAGEIRLQWWGEALHGARDPEVAAHPVARALLETLDRCQLPVQPMLDLIDARRFDLYEEPMATLADLDDYARKTSSTLFATAALILAGDARECARAADCAGVAYAFAALLRVALLHAARRQLYLPCDILDRHGARPEDIFAGQPSPAVTSAFAEMRSIAQRHFCEFLACARALPRAARPAFLPVMIVRPLLARLGARASRPALVVDVSPLRRQMAILRAAWFGFPPS